MRVLDLDLDFFLNKNAYAVGHHHGRLGPEYHPWQAARVRHFLEGRCCLALVNGVPGRIVKNHNEVLSFWRALIVSGKLEIPFDVTHIDAHPDFWVGWGLNLAPGYLRLQPEKELAIFRKKPIHEGNFLTFAIARGWVKSLVWVPLVKSNQTLPAWDADARIVKTRLRGKSGDKFKPTAEHEVDIPYRIVPWNKFRSLGKYDFADLSRSPGFTPPESDKLIEVIESYIQPV